MALPPNACVIAEADSWFDYPPSQVYKDPEDYEANRRDVLKFLKAQTVGGQPAYNVDSVAVAGDRVEDMRMAARSLRSLRSSRSGSGGVPNRQRCCSRAAESTLLQLTVGQLSGRGRAPPLGCF
jgi:hypothetical protein